MTDDHRRERDPKAGKEAGRDEDAQTLSKKYRKALEIERKGGRPEEVVKLLGAAHREGCSKATYALATLYLHGKHVSKDLKKAQELLFEAASMFEASALYDAAYAFEVGAFGELDEKQAFSFYLMSAVMGERQSIYELARCFYYGIGIEKDEKIWHALGPLIDHFDLTEQKE